MEKSRASQRQRSKRNKSGLKSEWGKKRTAITSHDEKLAGTIREKETRRVKDEM